MKYVYLLSLIATTFFITPIHSMLSNGVPFQYLTTCATLALINGPTDPSDVHQHNSIDYGLFFQENQKTTYSNAGYKHQRRINSNQFSPCTNRNYKPNSNTLKQPDKSKKRIFPGKNRKK